MSDYIIAKLRDLEERVSALELKGNPLFVTCRCGKSFLVKREGMSYWPDKWWNGAIQARYKCPFCGHGGQWIWAHELPIEWQQDAVNDLERLRCEHC